VRTIKEREVRRNEQGAIVREENEEDQEPPYYHIYRIPLNEPESLFFTALKNAPKSLPEIIVTYAAQRKDLPLNNYK
jgi:hypothetical protein